MAVIWLRKASCSWGGGWGGSLSLPLEDILRGVFFALLGAEGRGRRKELPLLCEEREEKKKGFPFPTGSFEESHSEVSTAIFLRGFFFWGS